MKAAIIGLGKMGANMARRLIQGGHEIIGFNRTESVTLEMAESDGIIPTTSLEEVVGKLSTPRIVWVMVPAGDPTEETIQSLKPLLSEGDILIDGGNSNYKDTVRRGVDLKESGINFIDVGTSGGIWLPGEVAAKMIDQIGDSSTISPRRLSSSFTCQEYGPGDTGSEDVGIPYWYCPLVCVFRITPTWKMRPPELR